MTTAAIADQRLFRARPEPCAVAEDLIGSGLARDYVLYERPGEARIAVDFLARITLSANRLYMEQAGGPIISEPAVDPFKQVESLFESLPLPAWTAYGYFAFDLAGFYYPYSWAIARPLLQLVVPRVEIRIDTTGTHVTSADGAGSRSDAATGANDPERGERTALPWSDLDRLDFCLKVKTLVDAIREGGLVKAILSQGIALTGALDLLATYRDSSRANNARRSYCFRLGDVSAVGFSPETLLEGDARGHVRTCPLAGTRPRSPNVDEDGRWRTELFTDAKEVKEHTLSIRLAQAEIASVCRPHSVRIHDFMNIERFRRVQHLSSRVSGLLDDGRTTWDALKALFPGVTVSGIEKHEALRWISDLEGGPRGVYGGAVGWLDSCGAADLAIAIRSVFQYGDEIRLNAGAGIVAESVPEREYGELVNKLRTMFEHVAASAGPTGEL
jgi:salicylate synthetase